MKKLKETIICYLHSLSGDSPGVYKNCTNGENTLYASCFAVMCFHYLGELSTFSKPHLQEWSDYILSHQSGDGKFVGPEISAGKLLSNSHTHEHLSWHLTCHVLPALRILQVSPRHPISFIDKYLDSSELVLWLEDRNWNEAWLEGNNLLFMGQLLTYKAIVDNNLFAKQNVELILDWLDEKVEPATGLWGTQGSSDNYAAAYGGYHQLLLYYFWSRNVPYKEALIDTVLALQHFDGGFSRDWGGGSCEDIDCVDILVNLYKTTKYRRADIERSLLNAAFAILRRHASDGGFVYKVDEEFYHMGMEYTYAPPNVANIFSTWFGIHTLALISEIIEVPKLALVDFKFNNICSMGWHKKWDNEQHRFNLWDNTKAKTINIFARFYFLSRKIKRSSTALNKLYSYMK